MKKMKKLLSLVLSVAMVVAMGVTVFAETQNYTISTKADDDHIYSVYQIFTADLSSDASGKTVLSNVTWGESAKNGTGKVDETTVKSISELTGTDQELANAVSQYVDFDKVYKTVDKNTSASVPTGYYLIKDATAVSGNDAATTYILKVTNENIEISRKTNKPSSEKKVKDTNDTTGDTTGWQDSADYDIGDQVPFQLKGTVAANYDSYTTYKFAFHDKESAGLTFNKDSVVVKVDGNEITSGYEIVTDTTDGDTFDVVFANLKDIPSVTAGSVITVEYTSELNSDAVIGSTGNPNTMHLEYSNNPNTGHEEETGTTPDDTVIVFTYKVVANKVDENNKPLTGASFKLEKKLKNGSWKDLGTINGTDKTTFEWSGLDDGDYRITETVTPAGHNSIEPIVFTIEAGHVTTSDAPTLTSLKGGDLFTGEVSTGAVSANIVNKKGSTLPSTGGIGTTIFYVIGGILMVGAGVILISRKRTNK